MLPVLAQAVRRLENAVQRGRVSGSDYARYQAIALLAREERGRVRSDSDLTQVRRDSELKRLDGIGTILAQIAAQEPSFFHLLDEKADISDGTRSLIREMQVAAGREPEPEPAPDAKIELADGRVERRVVPQA
ncbi:MAG: ATP-dependent helicase, partial [Nocardioides sp.]